MQVQNTTYNSDRRRRMGSVIQTEEEEEWAVYRGLSIQTDNPLRGPRGNAFSNPRASHTLLHRPTGGPPHSPRRRANHTNSRTYNSLGLQTRRDRVCGHFHYRDRPVYLPDCDAGGRVRTKDLQFRRRTPNHCTTCLTSRRTTARKEIFWPMMCKQ